MKIWFRRILALALLSMGIACVFLPFNDTRSGSVDQGVVYLQKEELLNPDEISIQFPEEDIIEVSGPELNPDDYPYLWWVLNDLNTDWMTDTCSLKEWISFQNVALQGEKDFRLIVFRETLIGCSVVNESNKEAAAFAYMGKYNIHIKELSKSDLKKYPSIIKAIENIDLCNGPLSELITIPKYEWDKMVTRYLNPFKDYQTFKFEGTFYGPAFAWDTIWKTGTVAGLKTILKVIGIVITLIGFLLIRRLYFRKQGIMVNPIRVAILYDVIILLFAIPSAYMFANIVLSKTLFITSITNEDFILLMGSFFFCLGIPFVTLYTSRFTSQSVLINPDGIFVDSLLSKDSISWELLDLVELSNEYVLVSRVGMPLPKQLQKSLRLVSKEGQQLIINEPQIKSVKREIISKFEEYAPDLWKNRLSQVLSKW